MTKKGASAKTSAPSHSDEGGEAFDMAIEKLHSQHAPSSLVEESNIKNGEPGIEANRLRKMENAIFAQTQAVAAVKIGMGRV